MIFKDSARKHKQEGRKARSSADFKEKHETEQMRLDLNYPLSVT